jgi:nicotinic acetylcholine receptor
LKRSSAKNILVFQIDLKHINQKVGEDKVEVGIDLREYYPSVEWDILGVPAERHEKYYPCCAEPYPGNKLL